MYGLDLMLSIFKIVQGISSTIMSSAGFGNATGTVIPQEIISAIESCGFFESIPLWAITIIRRVIHNCTFICYDNECVW